MGKLVLVFVLRFWGVQLKKQRLKEKIEEDVGALVQFLLDEKDTLLDSLDAELVATTAVIDENLKKVESEAVAVDNAIAEIRNHFGGKPSFEVSLGGETPARARFVYTRSECVCVLKKLCLRFLTEHDPDNQQVSSTF